MNRIDSVQNPLVKRMRALKRRAAREAENLMLIEGEKLVIEALNANLRAAYAFVREDKVESLKRLTDRLAAAGAEVYAVPARVIEAMSDTVSPQGICAAYTLAQEGDLSGAPDRLVALDGVQDPGNVGTIWRTADAAGYGGLLLGADTADAFSPKVQRAAMGSSFRVPSTSVDLPVALKELKDAGYMLVATALGGVGLYDRPKVNGKFVVIIGSEAKGVNPEILEFADLRLSIPMRGGAESLNAAVAAGIVLYDLTREQGDEHA